MGSKVRLFYAALFLLLVLHLGFAATEDFQFVSFSRVEACACSYFVSEAMLSNTGDVPSNYYIEHSGTASDFISVLPPLLSGIEPGVGQGSQAKVYYYYNVPCYISGEYTLRTTIKTALGLEKAHDAVVSVKQCNPIEVNLVSQNSRVCLGNVVTYEFDFLNKQAAPEVIIPSAGGLSGTNYQFSLQSYDISRFGRAKAYLYVPVIRTGVHSFTARFAAKNTGFSYELPLDYEGVDCKAKTGNATAGKTTTEKTASERKSDIKIGIFASLGRLAGQGIMLAAKIVGVLFIIAIVFLLALLLARVLGKKRRMSAGRDSLSDWVELKLPKKEAKQEIVKKEEKPKAEMRILRKEKKKEKQTKLRGDVRRRPNKKTIALVLLIIILLLLSGLSFMLLYTKMAEIRESVGSIFSESKTKTNLSSSSAGKSMAVSKPKNMTAITSPAAGLKTIRNASVNASLRTPVNKSTNLSSNKTLLPINATGLSLGNPAALLFRSFTASCTLSITVFLVVFILSLLLLGTNARAEWGRARKGIFKIVKYGVPVILFFCLVLSIVYCQVNNTCSETLRCARITISNITLKNAANLTANITSNMTAGIAKLGNATNVVIEQQPAFRCLCSTLFGDDTSVWVCLLWLVGLVCIIIFIAYLMFRKPGQDKQAANDERSGEAVRKAKLATAKAVAEKRFLERKLAERKKPAKKPGKGEKEHEPVSIWKDLVLLLILLIILFGIGAFIYYYSPMSKNLVGNASNFSAIANSTNKSIIMPGKTVPALMNISGNASGTKGVNVNASKVILSPVNTNLICNVSLVAFNSNEGIVTPGAPRINISASTLTYSWYNDRSGGYKLLLAESQSNRLSGNLTRVGDMWICQVRVSSGNSTIYVNSTPYKIIEKPTSSAGKGTQRANVSTATGQVAELIKYIALNNLTGSFSYQVLESGGTKTIDLSRYFADPDNDVLMYTVSGISNRNVSIDIWRGNATISASPGFIGAANATFTAEDPSGEKVSANMTIVVTEKSTENPVLVFVENYINYIIFGVVILLLIILLFSAHDMLAKKQGESEETKEMQKGEELKSKAEIEETAEKEKDSAPKIEFYDIEPEPKTRKK